MKQILFSNWNFVRIFRLGIGLAVLVQAIATRDVLFGLAGILFSGLAIFNVACCGMGGCPTYSKLNNTHTNHETSFEEVD